MFRSLFCPHAARGTPHCGAVVSLAMCGFPTTTVGGLTFLACAYSFHVFCSCYCLYLPANYRVSL